MTEDELREAAGDPECPLTYEELWDVFFAPRGASLRGLIEQFEAKLRPADEDPQEPPAHHPGD